MELAQGLRSLTLEGLNFGETLDDGPDYYSGLVTYDEAGLEAKTTASGEIAVLTAQLTPPEVRETLSSGIHGAMRHVVAQSGLPFNDRDPASERQRMTDFMQRLGLPFGPEASVGEVHAHLDSICPALLWTKPWDGNQAPAGTKLQFRQCLALAHDAVAIEGLFRNERLSSFTVLDLRNCVAADRFGDSAKAARASAREQALAELAVDPRPAAFKYGAFFSSMEVEWQKNLQAPQKEERQEDEFATANSGKLPVSREPKKKGLLSGLLGRGKVDDLDDAMRNGETMQRQQKMVEKYGDLLTMLQQQPESDVLHESANWFLFPEEAEEAENLSIGRMAWVLRGLHDDLAKADGVQGWLEFHLDDEVGANDAFETMAALQHIGANELHSLFVYLAEKARGAGFDPSTSQGWEAFFEAHPDTDREDKFGYEHAQKIPAQFIRYVETHPELVKAGEQRVAEITARRPLEFIDGEELMASMTGVLGILVKPMMGMMSKSLKRLSKMEGMDAVPMPDLAELEEGLTPTSELAGAQRDLFRRQREETLASYRSIAGVVQNAPADSLLQLVASAGGYHEQEQFPREQLAEVSRMAGELNEWIISAECGVEFWLESAPPEELKQVIALLAALGSPLGEMLNRAVAGGQKAGASQDPDFDWLEFLGEHPELWPEEEDEVVEPLLEALPGLFREYWKGRAIEEPVPVG